MRHIALYATLIGAVATALLLLAMAGSLLPLETPSAVAQGPDEPAPTPVTVEVTPIVVPIDPVEEIVAPIEGIAEAETRPAEQGLGSDSESSGLFTGVRGGFIAAGIAAGALVMVWVVVTAVRLGLKRARA